jgi:hypothetical protein
MNKSIIKVARKIKRTEREGCPESQGSGVSDGSYVMNRLNYQLFFNEALQLDDKAEFDVLIPLFTKWHNQIT